MDFEDAVNGVNINTQDIQNEEAIKAAAKIYRMMLAGFTSEGFTELEAKTIAYRVFMDLLMGRA